MYLLIFIRISAATLRGRQTKSRSFAEILKAQKLKVSRRPSINEIFYCFAPLGFGIAEYNDRPIVKKKMKGGGRESVPENGHKFQKMKSIVPDLSEKIMAYMFYVMCYILICCLFVQFSMNTYPNSAFYNVIF